LEYQFKENERTKESFVLMWVWLYVLGAPQVLFLTIIICSKSIIDSLIKSGSKSTSKLAHGV